MLRRFPLLSPPFPTLMLLRPIQWGKLLNTFSAEYKRLEFSLVFFSPPLFCCCRTYRFFLPLRKKRKHYLLIFFAPRRESLVCRGTANSICVCLHVLESPSVVCWVSLHMNAPPLPPPNKWLLLWCKILSSVITFAMHLMAVVEAVIFLRLAFFKAWSLPKFAFRRKRKLSHSSAFEHLCIRNIVLREFMFMGDYNENDYLYLPKS